MAFGDLIEMVGIYVVELLVGAAGPSDIDCGDQGGVGKTEVGAEIALGKVATAAGNFSHLGNGAGGDFDSCAHGVAVAFGADEFEINPVIFVERLIVEESRRVAIVGDDDVDVAVVVEIGEGDAAGGADWDIV